MRRGTRGRKGIRHVLHVTTPREGTSYDSRAVGTVIVNWNTARELEACVESFLADEIPKGNIVVVDQGSSDGSARMMKRKFRGVRVLSTPENHGYGQAANLGSRLIKGEWLVVANADVRFGPGVLRKLVETLRSDVNVAVVGPRIFSPEGGDVTRFRKTSALRSVLLLFTPRRFRGTVLRAQQEMHRASSTREVPFVEGCFLVFRRTTFEECGGFDEGFRFFGEDADIVHRLRALGHRAVHCSNASIVHSGGASFRQAPRRLLPDFYRGILRFYRIHQNGKYRLLKHTVLWAARIRYAIDITRSAFGDVKSAGRHGELVRMIERERQPQKTSKLVEKALVSVVIPTKDREKTICSLLEDLRRQTYRPAEVLVIDQSGRRSSRTIRALHLLGNRGKYIQISRANRSHARNVGFRYATGNIVLFLDDDIEIAPELIATHVAAYSDPTVGAASCRVVEDSLPPSRTKRILRITWFGRMIAGFQSDVKCRVETLAGQNMSVLRSLMERVGGFDPALTGTSIFEEPDLSARIRGEGASIQFTNATTVVHHPQTGGNDDCRKTDPTEYYRSFHANEMIYFLKNRPRIFLCVVIPFCMLRALRQSSRFRLSTRDALRMFGGITYGMTLFKRLNR